MGFSDYSTTPASNTSIGDDIYIGPNMERGKVRPALQQLAADGKGLSDAVNTLANSGVNTDGLLRADLASTAGATLIGVGAVPDAVGMQTRPLIEYVREMPLNAEMFDAVGNGVADDTGALQKMLDEAVRAKRPILMNHGTYLITDSLTLHEEVRWEGVSSDRVTGTTILNDIADLTKPAIDIYCSVGNSIIGLTLAHLHIATPGSYEAGWAEGGVAVRLNTAPGYAASRCQLHDIAAMNHRLGFDLGGVIYESTFERLLCSGHATLVGPPLGPSIAGFRSGVIGYEDITYNSFTSCEASSVRDGGLAYDMSSQFSTWINCTADGPSRLTSIGGTAINFTCEGFTPDTLPSGVNYAMNFTGFGLIVAPRLRAIPSGKVPIGIFVGGDGFTLIGAGNSDGAPPNLPIYLDGVGTLIGINMTGVVNKIPLAGDGGLNGSVAIACNSVTDFGISGTGTALRTQAGKVGFFGTAPINKPTGVAVTAEAIHAALVNLGLLGA